MRLSGVWKGAGGLTMADFPAAISTFRGRANIPGQTYDEEKTTTIYNEDLVRIEGQLQAIETTIGAMLANIFPIGSLYINQASDDTPEALGIIGTWTLEQEGSIPDVAYIWRRTA